jgi:cyclase
MALTKRIIPCLDLKDGRVVKGVNFLGLRDAGDPVEFATKYNEQGADEVAFLDISSSKESRAMIIDVIKRAADKLTVPLTVGGGIRSIADIREILEAGADKVSINTSAVQNPELISEATVIFGPERIIAAIDVQKNPVMREGVTPITMPDGTVVWYEVVISGGNHPTGIDAVEWAQEVARRGAGEILSTSIETDGVKQGFDVAVTAAVADAVRIPVIASGGVGTLEHFYDGFTVGHADACLAASVFHFGEMTVKEVKEYLRGRDVPVRI